MSSISAAPLENLDVPPVARTEVAFILDNVADYATLVAGVRPGVEVVVLDGSRDGLAQMAEWAQTHSGYDAIHVLSHGAQGQVQLGSLALDSSNLAAHAATLAQIGSALAADGDLLLYGCNVAGGDAGVAFMGKLAQATGADLAASTDLTGGAAQGGDWVLESHSGQVGSAPLAFGTYAGTLAATVTANFVTGLDVPTDLVTDAQNNLYITSWSGNKLYKINASGGAITGGDVTNATPFATITNITTVAIDGSGNMYVGTGNGTIHKFAQSGGIPGSSSSLIGSGFDLVSDLLVTADGKLYVSDSGSTGSKVYEFLAAGPGLAPGNASQQATVNGAQQIYIDGSNNLYAVSADDNKVYKFAASGGAVSLASRSDFIAGLSYPLSITGDGTSFYVSDSQPGNAVFYKFGASGGSVSGSSVTGGTLEATHAAYSLSELFWAGNGVIYAAADDNTVAKIQVASPAPTVTGITSSTANGTYKAGDSISIQVTFSEAVTVSGTPQLTLETGTTDRVVNYASGSGANTLTFTYTVQAGDTSIDLDYASTTALALNSGSITATSGGTAATLTLPSPGAAGSLGANKNIVIDTTAPAAPSAPDMAAGSDSGSSSTDNVTTVTAPTFTGTAEAGSAVTLYDTDGTTVLGSATATGGVWSITSSTLASGSHTLTAKATDTAGNVSTASTGLTVVIDTTPPAAPSAPDMAAGSDLGSSSSDNITSTSTPIFTGTAEAGSTVTLYDTNGSTVLGTATATGGAWSITSSTLGEGSHTITAKATDAAGNVSAASSGLAITIDTTAPTQTFSAIALSADTGVAGDFTTNTAAQTITATLSAALGVGDKVFGSLDGGATWVDITSKVSGTSLSWDGASLSGTSSIKLKVQDTAGNDGTVASQAYMLDTTAPNAPSTPDMTAGSDSGSSSTDNKTNATTPTFTGTAEAGSTVTLYDTNGSTVLGTATATGGNWSITSSFLVEGSHTITAKATDAVGNVSSASSGLAVVIDTVGPASMALSTTTVMQSAATNGSTVATLSATDITSVAYAFQVGNGVIDADNGKFSISGNSLVAAQNLTAGTYHIYLSGTDAAGNPSYQIFTFNVTNAPTVTSIVRASSVSVPASAASVAYTVTFSQAVTGVDAADFTLTSTGTAAGSIGTVTGSGTTYTVTVTGLSGDGTLRLDLKTSGTGIANGSSTAILGGFSAGEAYTLDHTAPTQTFSALALSADTGLSGTDGITSTAAQTVTATLSAGLTGSDKVYGSLDNGATWLDITSMVSGTGLTWTGVSLSGSNTLKLKVQDAAGNDGAVASKTYVLDTMAPTFDPAGSSPADDSIAAVVPITVRFSEALASLSDLTKVYLKDVATHTLVPATVTLNGSGELVITPTGALAEGVAYYVSWDASALKDAAGNAVVAVSNSTTYNFTTPAPTSSNDQTEIIDGTVVQISSSSNSNGSTTTTQTVAPVTSSRPEDTTTSHGTLADIPLAKDGSGATLLQIGLPVGVGVISQATDGGSLTLREKLIAASEPRTLPADFAEVLQQGIDAYVPTVASEGQVTVRTLTLSSSGGTAPRQPITITGATGTGESDAAHPLRQEALVIDARQLPAGSVLDLSQVEFAIVIGAVQVIGGAGRNIAVGDGSAQVMILGADDDVLRGGAGNDTVGSKGGSDQLYGDEGDDWLAGGADNDQLWGGNGSDVLQGGASDAGVFRVQLAGNGTLLTTFVAKNSQLAFASTANHEGVWLNPNGTVIADDRLFYSTASTQMLADVAMLFKGVFGQLPTMAQLGEFASGPWSSTELAQAAYGVYVARHPGQGVAATVQGLVEAFWGAGQASEALVQEASQLLGAGGAEEGHWAQALLILARSALARAGATDAQGQLSLAQAYDSREIGIAWNSGNDTLHGGAGNDRLVGGDGNDLLDGGEGVDIAAFTGVIGAYRGQMQTDGSILLRNLATGEVDTLMGVELAQIGSRYYGLNPAHPSLPVGQEVTLEPYLVELTGQQVATLGGIV